MSEIATKIIDTFTNCKLKLKRKKSLVIPTNDLSYVEGYEPEQSFGGNPLIAPIQKVTAYVLNVVKKSDDYIVLN